MAGPSLLQQRQAVTDRIGEDRTAAADHKRLIRQLRYASKRGNVRATERLIEARANAKGAGVSSNMPRYDNLEAGAREGMKNDAEIAEMNQEVRSELLDRNRRVSGDEKAEEARREIDARMGRTRPSDPEVDASGNTAPKKGLLDSRLRLPEDTGDSVRDSIGREFNQRVDARFEAITGKRDPQGNPRRNVDPGFSQRPDGTSYTVDDLGTAKPAELPEAPPNNQDFENPPETVPAPTPPVAPAPEASPVAPTPSALLRPPVHPAVSPLLAHISRPYQAQPMGQPAPQPPVEETPEERAKREFSLADFVTNRGPKFAKKATESVQALDVLRKSLADKKKKYNILSGDLAK